MTPGKNTILIVEDEAVIAEHLRMVLEDNGYTVCGVEVSVNRALASVSKQAPSLVLIDIFLRGELSGIQLAHSLNERDIPFVYVSANYDRQTLEAAKATCPYGFLVKPFREKDLLITIDIARYRFENNRQLRLTKGGAAAKLPQKEPRREDRTAEPVVFAGIIGASTLMQKVFRLAGQVAGMNTSVLILGESGTGKEGIATAIHQLSPRSNKPLVKVNCAALPLNLIESELFGHEKGAFTGALQRKIGKFERADGGTIFLDEIGEMPPDVQVKLLRVLQEREIERIGGDGPIRVDVRVIAATNRNLEAMIADSTFRLDLYYRLNVFPIQMPSLRQRAGDIPLLANHFAAVYSQRAGRSPVMLAYPAMRQLEEYSWPGNIRELQNIIERNVLMVKGDVLENIDLPYSPVDHHPGGISSMPADLKTISDVERNHIVEVLKRCRNKLSGPGGAAEFLKLPPSTLYSKMKKLGIATR